MRPPARFLTVAALVLLGATACDRLLPTAMAPKPAHIRLDRPDPEFHLSSADRAKVVPGFDVDALERLLASVTPEMRQEVLAFFQWRSPEGEPRGHLYQILDPKLQAILEEVWAPMWDSATDEQIAENAFGMPGRKIAEKRRQERRATETNAPD
jgi:hypothetical protein